MKRCLLEKIKWLLYLIAALLVGFPIFFAVAFDVPFSSTFSNIVLSLAIILLMIGKTITILRKNKENNTFSSDIGAVIGLFIVLIITVI